MATVMKNIGCLATCCIEGRQADIHPIQNAAIVWDGPVITWVGPEHNLPQNFHDMVHWDAGGRLVIPGLIDCHTHLAFGGWRADEFVQRIQGDLAKGGKGGFSDSGIIRTVKQTRACSAEDLLHHCLEYLNEMAKLGVTTVECKSGYGLTVEHELKQLNVYRTLNEHHPMRIVSTFLGAHALPPEYQDNRSGYVDLLQKELIPLIADQRLAQFCDVFVEETAFTLEEGRRILETGKRHGLRAKIHADQLTHSGGSRLAAELGAISADHLEHTPAEGLKKMAKTDVVAVSLPLASLYLHQKPFAARPCIDAGIPLAVSTDFNPGTAPSFHLPFAMTLACTLQRMTPAEVLKGTTIYAAKALGLQQTIGSLEPGKDADFAVIDAPDVNHWLYHLRPNACFKTVIQGNLFSQETDEEI